LSIPEKLHCYRVLAVDDNKTNRIILQEILKSFGLTVDIYESAGEALQALQSNKKYRIIISDFLMPEMNGLEFLKEVRKTSAIPAIVLTSVGAWGKKSLFKDLENISYLTKPVKQSVLFNAIVEMLGMPSKYEKKEIKQESYDISRLKSLPDSIRILLAEDNMINQLVIKTLIQKANIAVDVVNDGIMAIQAVQEKYYDLVLMDVQMPKMDGLAATIEIRETLKMMAIPIIAMTANAMKGDREKCLVAGMNDYLSKPINPNKLFSILETWLLDRKDQA
jgi:two-component system sensor histidine kinase/response regulator